MSIKRGVVEFAMGTAITGAGVAAGLYAFESAERAAVASTCAGLTVENRPQECNPAELVSTRGTNDAWRAYVFAIGGIAACGSGALMLLEAVSQVSGAEPVTHKSNS